MVLFLISKAVICAKCVKSFLNPHHLFSSGVRGGEGVL